MNGAALIAYQETKDVAMEMDISSLPDICVAASGDVFAYSGTIICAGIDSTNEYRNKPNCLPTSCTSDEETMGMLLTSMDAPEGEECTGYFT